MSARASRRLGGLALAALVALGSGCGDARLWSRYRAERDFWHARRQVDRLQLNPRFVTDADYDRASAAFRRVVTGYPAAEWARADRLDEPYVRDVALLSGRAAIALARIQEMRGRSDAAIAGYTAAIASYAAVPAVALEAALARARALERAGRVTDALLAWRAVWREFPLVDEASGAAVVAVLDAPLRVARQIEAEGRRAAADSVLRDAEARYAAALEQRAGGPAAPELWTRLAEARAGLGDVGGALAALRAALREPAAEDLVPRLVLTLAERADQGGLADTALTYARWAESAFDTPTRADAVLLKGRIFESASRTDSALAAYATYIDDYPGALAAVAGARFRRGVILEGLGLWEQARTEYRTLIARHPTHELSFDALDRIVAWHVRRGEDELARIEGRRGIETLDQILATQRDHGVQLLARRARAGLLEQVGRPEEACEALADLWQRYPETPAGVAAAIRAAQIAETRLDQPERALAIYEDLAERAGNPDTQRAARAAAERLRRAAG